MEPRKTFSLEEAKSVGDQLAVNWSVIDPEQFRAGMDVELEHGLIDQETDVTNDDSLMTGKIAFTHLKEFSDYYIRLAKMEAEAKGKV